MIKRIKKLAKNNKTLIQNFSYLSALQVFSMLLPLITYPYLIRVLGKETYGLIVFAQAIIGYLVLIVGFGFNISATKEVSIHRYNKSKLSEIVSSVLIIKAVLFLFAIFILSILLWFIPKAEGYEALFYLSMWTCLYNLVFPMWYFQGIEKMKYITYITLVSRLIFVGLIFVFIHAPSDYLFVPIINGIGALFAGIISLYLIFVKHKIKFKSQPIQTLKLYFIDSLPIFISNISIKLYVNTNKVIVGAFLGMTEVAYYDLAEKVTTILKTPQGILSQTLFPKISKEKNTAFIKKVFKFSTIMNLILFLFVVIASKHIVLLLGGAQMINAIVVLNILAITIPIIAMSNVFAVQMLIPFGYKQTFSKIIVTSGIIYLLQIGILWFTTGFNILNISIITVTTEVFVTAYSYYYCKKYGLWN